MWGPCDNWTASIAAFAAAARRAGSVQGSVVMIRSCLHLIRGADEHSFCCWQALTATFFTVCFAPKATVCMPIGPRCSLASIVVACSIKMRRGSPVIAGTEYEGWRRAKQTPRRSLPRATGTV